MQALITGALGARVDGVVTDIAGLPETMKTVDRLAADMNYVIAHTKNITECAADGASDHTLTWLSPPTFCAG